MLLADRLLTLSSLADFTRELGGPALVKAPGYALLVPLVLMGSLLVIEPDASPQQILTWLVVNLLAISVCWLWFELFRQIVFKNRFFRAVPPAQILIFGFGIGFLKGAATGAFSWVFSLEQNLLFAVQSRVLQTSLTGIFLVFGLTMLEALRLRLQAERDELVIEKFEMRLMAERNHSAASLRELAGFIEKATATLDAERTKFEFGARDFKGLASVIRMIVENSLRPLSHRLWQSENSKIQGFSYRDLVQAGILGQQITAWPVAVFFFVGTFLSLLSREPILSALLRCGLDSIIVLLFLLVAKKIRPKKLSSGLAYLFAIAASATSLIILVNELVFGSLESFSVFAVWWSVFLWLLELLVLSSMLNAAVLGRQNVLRERANILENTIVNGSVMTAQSKIASRELANYLHGTLQNQLLASAMRIENSKAENFDLDTEFRLLEQLIDDASIGLAARGPVKFSDGLAETATRWAGFATLEIENHLTDAQVAALSNSLIEIINEGVSNAVRHGMAQNLKLKIAPNVISGRIEIELADDGVGPRNRVSGLGTKLFNSVAGHDWQLSPGDAGGSLLVLNMPLTTSPKTPS